MSVPPQPRNRPSPATRPSPLMAILVTIVAFTTLNLAAAYSLARTAGMRGVELAPAILWGAVVVGLAAVVLAVLLWRRYLTRRPAG